MNLKQFMPSSTLFISFFLLSVPVINFWGLSKHNEHKIKYLIKALRLIEDKSATDLKLAELYRVHVSNYILSSKSSREDAAYFFSFKIILWSNLPMSTIFKVASNKKWTCRRFKNVLHDTVLHTDALCQISGSWPLWFPRKMWQKLSCEQICLCPQYSKVA